MHSLPILLAALLSGPASALVFGAGLMSHTAAFLLGGSAGGLFAAVALSVLRSRSERSDAKHALVRGGLYGREASGPKAGRIG